MQYMSLACGKKSHRLSDDFAVSRLFLYFGFRNQRVVIRGVGGGLGICRKCYIAPQWLEQSFGITKEMESGLTLLSSNVGVPITSWWRIEWRYY